MKKVLVDIDKKEYKKIDKKAIDIIEATSEIQPLSESILKLISIPIFIKK